jgi:acetoin utilization deacetylase AcuC-like enzyme
MAERARRSVGATVAAARAALFGGEGVAANLAGGTHHAYANKGSGYCVFNDAAVAARLMQAEWRRRAVQPGESGSLQVWVIDLDVHQGNGTAAIFGKDRSVFTFSMHGARNFPFRKEASDLDIELDDGTGDAAYLAALQAGLAQCEALLEGQGPGLAFYLAGADPHENDRLGRLKLTSQGLAQRDELVLRWLRERRIPVALSMAGGYGRDIALTVDVHRQTLRLACDSWRRWAAECSS